MSQQQRVLNKKLSQIFRINGLTVRPDAMQPLYDVLEGEPEWESVLNQVLEQVQQQKLKGGCVGREAVETALSSLAARKVQGSTLPFEAVDAFALPPMRFDSTRKALLPAESAPLHADALAKAALFATRLALVEQRVRRNELFKPPVLAHGAAQKEFLQLTNIDALAGRSGTRVVLGMLTELQEGTIFLEDAHGYVPLDLTDAKSTTGLFTRHSIVLAEGEMTAAGVFRVSVLGLPPMEPRALSIASLGGVDLLRPPAAAAEHASTVAGTDLHPAGAASAMVIVLSDVWLDQPSTLAQLEVLFGGYEAEGAKSVKCGKTPVPVASFFVFVLCGNFSSPAAAAANTRRAELTALFRNLAAAAAKFPSIAQHSRWVLVPGPDDPCRAPADVLPRAPLSEVIAADVLRALPHAELLSSPARLVVCGQQVVIAREGLLAKMKRCVVVPPNVEAETSDLHKHLVKTLLDQAHLNPLPPTESAAYWKHDHALWLHPAPEVLVLADRGNQYDVEYEDTLAFNPGAFATTFSWQVYYPDTRKAEVSSLSE